MRHDLKDRIDIGSEFITGAGRFRVTDIGSRVIVAIRIDEVSLSIQMEEGRVETEVLNQNEAEASGWFNGPTYAVAELVFDEDDQEAIEIVEDRSE